MPSVSISTPFPRPHPAPGKAGAFSQTVGGEGPSRIQTSRARPCRERVRECHTLSCRCAFRLALCCFAAFHIAECIHCGVSRASPHQDRLPPGILPLIVWSEPCTILPPLGSKTLSLIFCLKSRYRAFRRKRAQS